MALLRAQKETLVNDLTEELNSSRIALIFAYTHLNSKGNLSLRDRAFEVGGKVKMLSNNSLRLILKNQNRELEIPEKQLALAYGFGDEVVAAKLLADFAKETESLEILAGWIDGKFFTAADVKTLASLPSKETLQAQVVGRLNGLIQGLVYDLNFPLQKLAYVISAIESSKQ
ncbi:MAG TPA: 50S ribosomal protein L10 [Candidatus Saccharimonadales bacterium]|nr:50S ribosomal protein L10 [Candidatus Saccharimonadales bacterium]